MSTLLINDIAQHIRRIDGNNNMPAGELGNKVMCQFYELFPDGRRSEVAAFVERTNPDKRMGAGALAELICAEFNLPKEGAA
ncbi:MAG TPA: hypothetical protein VI172_08225 [Candidatus Dormibacteraeota bacterium]|jgi:hypothetical protein